MRSLLTEAVLSVSRYIISTTYDHRRHPKEPKTSIIKPNTIINSRFSCKWVFGVPQKILKHLMEGPHLVLYVSRPSISTTYDQRRHPQGPKTSIITLNTIITFRICCKRLFGVLQKILKHLKESQHPQSLFRFTQK